MGMSPSSSPRTRRPELSAAGIKMSFVVVPILDFFIGSLARIQPLKQDDEAC
jgi:hypothetical protein